MDVATYFLGANQVNVQLRIIRGRAQAARGNIDFIARFRQQFHRRSLKAPFGNGDLQCAFGHGRGAGFRGKSAGEQEKDAIFCIFSTEKSQ